MEKIQNHMFSNKQLKALILPLFMEQFLVMLVGIADTFIVSYAGESAVSGVSLVNSFNTIFIYLFTALASGGAVVVSQYLGRKEQDNASEAVSQLLMISTVFSVVIMAVILMFSRPLLGLMFGKVDADVMDACMTYLRISAYSYPAMAVYNAGAAAYRSIGKTNTTMYISIAANVINVAGNLIGVFVLHAGVAGVAYPSLISRVFSAVVITVLCFRSKDYADNTDNTCGTDDADSKDNIDSIGNKDSTEIMNSQVYGLRYRMKWILEWNNSMQKRILGIAVPNGIESGIFQFVKVALSSVVAMFGTYQIAANGIAQSIWSLAALIGVTMGPVFITVIGQCMGAGETDQAVYYFRKLTKITLITGVIWNIFIFAVTPIMVSFYAVSDEAKRLVILLVLLHNVFNAVTFPYADSLGKGLRATGDVTFTTLTSIFTTVVIRLVFSMIFGIMMNMGVIGIALAMCLDWTIRGMIFWIRFKSGKWKKFKIIKD